MTKVLLDFDGVVNAFERALFNPGNPDDFTWVERDIEVSERNSTFTINYAQEVIDWINHNHNHIIWLSTWEKDSKYFSELGIVEDISYLGPDRDGYYSIVAYNKELRNGRWKREVGHKYIYDNPHEVIVWVDDDAYVNNYYFDNAYIINPDPRFGLRKSDINKISQLIETG